MLRYFQAQLEDSTFLGGAMEFVATFLEREDFDGAVGGITDPVFLHAEPGVELAFVMAIAAHAEGSRGGDLGRK